MICVFLANGFEEVEALTPVVFLRRCELDVKMVGVSGPVAVGSHGIAVACDLVAEELDLSQVEAVILPGGMPGTLNLEASDVVHQAVQACYDRGQIVAAICAAPSVLGHMGLLEGKKAVCFPGFEDQLLGAEYQDAPVVRDGNIITSKGAGTASQFAFALAEAFCSAERARVLREGIQWQA